MTDGRNAWYSALCYQTRFNELTMRLKTFGFFSPSLPVDSEPAPESAADGPLMSRTLGTRRLELAARLAVPGVAGRCSANMAGADEGAEAVGTT